MPSCYAELANHDNVASMDCEEGCSVSHNLANVTIAGAQHLVYVYVHDWPVEGGE